MNTAILLKFELHFYSMLQDIHNIKVTKTSKSHFNQVDWENLPFGKIFSDHMLVMDFNDG